VLRGLIPRRTYSSTLGRLIKVLNPEYKYLNKNNNPVPLRRGMLIVFFKMPIYLFSASRQDGVQEGEFHLPVLFLRGHEDRAALPVP